MRVELKTVAGAPLAFEAQVQRGDQRLGFSMDTSGMGSQSAGPSPKEALLGSLMACSAMDVVSLLRKYKVAYDSFSMTSNAEQTEKQPKVFVQIDLCYDFTGTDLPLEKLQEAVDLSMTLYCGVSAMLAPAIPIYYIVRVNGQIEHRGQAKFSTQPSLETP